MLCVICEPNRAGAVICEKASIAPQCNSRIHARCAPRWKITRNKGSEPYYKWQDNKRCQVNRTHAVKQA